MQYVVGNADGHGKNVSFFSRPQGLAIAPFYDIVSTVQYRELDAELAMAFGDEFDLAAVGPFDWADFAHRTNVPRAALVRETRRFGKATARHASELANSPEYTAEERDMALKIAAFASTQADRLLDMAGPTLEVDAKLFQEASDP